jgi:integrase
MRRYGKLKNGVRSYTTKRGEKRYRYMIRYEGRLHTKGGFTRQEAAKRALEALRRDLHDGRYVQDTTTTFGAFSEEWVTQADLRESTRAVYRAMLRGDLHEWHDVRLCQINERAVRQWLHTLRTRPAKTESKVLARSTVEKQYRLLKRILAVATAEHLIPANPCHEKMKVEEAELNIPTVADVARIAEAAPKQYRALVLLAGFGGLRWAEAIALRGRNLDTTHGMIQIRGQVVETVGGHVYEAKLLKTSAGRRDVMLPPNVMQALPHRADDELLFTGPDGTSYLRRSNFRRRVWLPALKKAGTRHFRFHDLRHAAVTTLMEHGATQAEAMQQVGHKDSRMMGRYLHARPEYQRTVVDSVGEAFAASLRPAVNDNVVRLRR